MGRRCRHRGHGAAGPRGWCKDSPEPSPGSGGADAEQKAGDGESQSCSCSWAGRLLPTPGGGTVTWPLLPPSQPLPTWRLHVPVLPTWPRPTSQSRGEAPSCASAKQQAHAIPRDAGRLAPNPGSGQANAAAVPCSCVRGALPQHRGPGAASRSPPGPPLPHGP